MARCPAHADRTPSLSVGVGGDGQILLCCHAGCDASAVVAALGLTMADLRSDVPPAGEKHKRVIAATYEYVDERGKPLYEVLRYEPKTFRQRRPNGAGGHLWNLQGVRHVLYRLPQVLAAAAAGSCIYVVEGEKDVEALERLGVVATCNSGGAGNWRDEYGAQLTGAKLAPILPDNDQAGREHARKVAASLGRRGVPHVTVELPGLPAKGDVSDWFAAGHTIDELAAIVAEQTDVDPKTTPRAAVALAASGGADDAYHLTELGNAERFAAQHADHVRATRGHGLLAYVRHRGIFVSDHAVLVRYAKQTVRGIYSEAGESLGDKTRLALGAHARRSESRKAIDAMLTLAAAEEALEADAKDFDADPELLNCTNGVVHLRSGTCLPHSPDYRMTKVAGTAYDPEAKAPVWRAHLERIFDGDAEIIAFLQRLYGCAMTGYNREQVFVVFYGEGANGKSDTVFGMTKALGCGGLDSYHKATAITTFTPHRNDHIRNSLAALAGARLVTTSENRISQTLDEGLIKEVTGGEDITARFLHREDFSFSPQFLLLVSTNHKPRVEAPDFAFKRRVLLVPFNVTLPETEWDRQHTEKLAAELGGILAWGVEGAVQYLASGLRVPEKVRAATEAYREEMDPLHAFREECMILDGAAFTPTAAIRATLERWAKDEGVKSPPGARELAAWLGRLGCHPEKRRDARGWHGLRLVGVDAEQAFDGSGEAS